jgi:serine/threonine-protein kinase
VSWWSKIFDRPEASPLPSEPPPPRAPAPPVSRPTLPADIAMLVQVGEPRGPSERDAIELLQRLRRTPNEARALEELLLRANVKPLPESLAIAVASAMIDRGEPGAAVKLLANATSPHALLVSADLHAEQGDLAAAVALTERILLRELDHPGARERHRRWRGALGLEVDPRRPDASGSTVVASEPDAPYVLLREVARGGAGAVYEAEDRDLGRRLALKVYHDPERTRAQLAHEARVATELGGRGVVRVFDIDPDHGWLALEWAPHGALRDAIRAKDLALLLPIERWALPLAATLARIHAAGWVHLDVKPANVLLGTGLLPLLADFGIARRAGESNTQGSFGYVSPERMAGRPAEPRDDVYGFGRILEDVLHLVESSEIAARWRPIAVACVAPVQDRLVDAQQIVTRLRTEVLAHA